MSRLRTLFLMLTFLQVLKPNIAGAIEDEDGGDVDLPALSKKRNMINCYFCRGVLSDENTDCHNESLFKEKPDACNGFCVVRVFTPEESGNKTIERNCYKYKRNFCAHTENRNGEKYEMCIRSCSTDLCNTGDNGTQNTERLNLCLWSLLLMKMILF